MPDKLWLVIMTSESKSHQVRQESKSASHERQVARKQARQDEDEVKYNEPNKLECYSARYGTVGRVNTYTLCYKDVGRYIRVVWLMMAVVVVMMVLGGGYR